MTDLIMKVWYAFFPPTAEVRAALLLREYENSLLDARVEALRYQQTVKLLEAQCKTLQGYATAKLHPISDTVFSEPLPFPATAVKPLRGVAELRPPRKP